MKRVCMALYLIGWVVFSVYSQQKKRYELDATFQTPDFYQETNHFYFSEPIVLPDGKIILCTSNFHYINGKHFSGNMFRLNQNGTLDESFKSNQILVGDEHRVFADGKVMIIPPQTWGTMLNITHLKNKENAGLDTVYQSYHPNFHKWKIQSDGKIIALGNDKLFRLLSNGQIDTTFRFQPVAGEQYDPYVLDLSLKADDKILLANRINKNINIQLFSKDGVLEKKAILVHNGLPFEIADGPFPQISFFPNGKLFMRDRMAKAYYIFDQDGKLEKNHPLPKGVFDEWGNTIIGSDDFFIERGAKMPYKIMINTNEATPLLKDTTLHPAFGAYKVSLLPQGQFLLTNYADELLWVDGQGNIIQKSKPKLGISTVNAVRGILANERILADIQNGYDTQLYRFYKDGKLDSNFKYQSIKPSIPPQYQLPSATGYYGDITAFNTVRNPEVFPLNDGSILMNRETDRNSIFVFYRNSYLLKSDGNVDSRFLKDSASTLPLPNNRFAIRQFSNPWTTSARFLIDKDGQRVAPQNEFEQRIIASEFYEYWPLKDQKNIVARIVSSDNQTMSLTRFLADGSVDASFAPVIISAQNYLKLKGTQYSDRLIIATNGKISRFNDNGLIDNSFQAALPDNLSGTAYIQEDQKIMVYGKYFNEEKASDETLFVRLNSDGSRDTTFRVTPTLDTRFISSIFPVSSQEILLVYKGRIERLVLDCSSLKPQITASKTEACTGENIMLKVNEVEGFRYQWQKDNQNITLNSTSTRLNTSVAGIYKIIAQDADCETMTSNELSIKFGSIPPAEISPLTNGNTSFRAILQANKGDNRFSYQWQKDSEDITGATKVSYEVSSSGNYTVKVTNNGCDNVSKGIFIDISPILGTESSSAESKLRVFPNPNNGTFQMDIPAEFKNGKVELFDVMGRALPLQQQNEHFQITNSTKGSYLIRISDGLKMITTKILVE